MNKFLSGEVDLLNVDATLGAIDWWIGETRQGWQGFATFKPAPGEGKLRPGYVFQRTVEAGIAPESPIVFGLWGRGESDYQYTMDPRGEDVEFVRSWPSVVTSLHAPHFLDMGTSVGDPDEGAMVLFCDPVTHLLGTRVWGVFSNRSAGELLAGGLLLAAGADAAPGLQPAVPGLPRIVIHEFLRTVRVPYAIASGETLGQWLGAILGRLGIRMELLGDRDGALHVSLRDGEPAGTPVGMSLGNRASATMAQARSFALGPADAEVQSGVLLDNPTLGEPRRIGEKATIGRVYMSAGTTLDEAGEQAARAEGAELLPYNTVDIVTMQPGFHPGRVVTFDKPLAGAYNWQVHGIHHYAEEGHYFNRAKIMKLGVWTPVPPPNRGAVIVSGVVYDPQAGEDYGNSVERDDLSRIPVRMSFAQGGASAGAGAGGGGASIKVDGDGEAAAGSGGGSNGSATNGGGGNGAAGGVVEQFIAPPPPELMLAVIGPMAGGEHGFVPEHRHGDICEVVVHDPMSAEIIGFSYADHLTVGNDMIGVTMGLVADHDQEGWSGVMFVSAPESEAGGDGAEGDGGAEGGGGSSSD